MLNLQLFWPDSIISPTLSKSGFEIVVVVYLWLIGPLFGMQCVVLPHYLEILTAFALCGGDYDDRREHW